MLDDAVATQDTVTQLIATIRRVIREVPGAAEAAASCCIAHDYISPGKPRIAWNDEQARAVLVDALVTDAIRLLAETCDQVLDARAADAIGILALVADQDVEPGEGSDGRDGRRRIARRTAPERMISTVDPEARHIHKSTTRTSDGFKAHLAVEPETGLLTAVAMRPGAGAAHHEAAVAPDLLTGEDHRVEVVADAAYSSGPCRRALTEAGHRLLIKPPPLRPAGPSGFTLDDFAIGTGTGLCPAGQRAVPVVRTPNALPSTPRPVRSARCGSGAPLPGAAGWCRSAPITICKWPPAAAPHTDRGQARSDGS